MELSRSVRRHDRADQRIFEAGFCFAQRPRRHGVLLSAVYMGNGGGTRVLFLLVRRDPSRSAHLKCAMRHDVAARRGMRICLPRAVLSACARAVLCPWRRRRTDPWPKLWAPDVGLIRPTREPLPPWAKRPPPIRWTDRGGAGPSEPVRPSSIRLYRQRRITRKNRSPVPPCVN